MASNESGPPVRIYAGAYADAYDLETHVLKITGPHRESSPAASISLTSDQRQAYAERLLAYQQRLLALGVPVPPPANTLAGVADESFQPGAAAVVVYEHAGETADSILLQLSDRESASAAVRGLLRAIRPVLLQRRDELGLVPTGIDVQPKNFARRGQQLCYIDFTPPRFFQDPEGYLIEFPQPTDIAVLAEGRRRFYSPAGILLQCLSYCSCLRLELRQSFRQMMTDELPAHLTDELVAQFPFLALPQSSARREWRAAIESAETRMELRAVACALAAPCGRRPARGVWLKHFFSRSAGFPAPLSIDMLASLRQELCRLAGGRRRLT